MTAQDDPYDRDENVFRTDGRDACHWCYLRPQAWVWGPYGTRVCDHCQQLIDAGRADEVVEECAARTTVHGGFSRLDLDPDKWRAREHDLMNRWLRIRTTCQRVDPAEDDDD